VIVEAGTHNGGSAVFLADIARLNGIDTEVITVDFNPKWTIDPKTRRILSVVGFSTDRAVFKTVEDAVRTRLGEEKGAVLVFLDSDHSRENVLNELLFYSTLVTPASYIVVEDTNINGHPSSPDNGPEPFEAVEDFLRASDLFERDLMCQRNLLTFNPGGWLRRRGEIHV
jgi:cephalosporin hydroxylase